MEDDNIFDEDDALDYIIFEELEAEGKKQENNNSGCFGVVVLLIMPVAIYLLQYQ